MSGKYDDIIDLPWTQPTGRDPMPMSERAAQFSPFAALTGFEKVIEKACRESEEKAERRK